jgi:dienelactone hydrolase
MKPIQRVRLVAAVMLLSGLASPVQAGRFFHRHQKSDCDQQIPAITSGYGVDGSYTPDIQAIKNPGFSRKPVQVFFPVGANGKRPVIFFSHGFGPGKWDSYADLIKHMVSRGYIVVFSSYAEAFTSNGGRYSSLWQGFQAAADEFSDRMDLTHVGFVGHSFGGGATPAMAYQGIVQHGWGKQGAFMMELAPWYSYQISNAQLQQFPASVLQLIEVYDQDDTNDHRMAIDIYDNSQMRSRYFFMVHSTTVDGCEVTADHSTPGRNVSLRQRQYAVFKPFDALADAAFNGSASALSALSSMALDTSGYQPLTLETHPAPAEAESYYKYPWNSDDNPRTH